MIKRMTLILGFVMFSGMVFGQNRQTFSVASATAETASFTFSWSLGEPLSGPLQGQQAALSYYTLVRTAIERFDLALRADVSPTVIDQSVRVIIPDEDLPVTVILSGIDGRIWMRTLLTNVDNTLQLPNLTASMYVLRLYHAQKTYSAKLIKQ